MNDFKAWQQKYRGLEGHGTAFEGTDGWVMVNRGALRTEPEKLAEEPVSPTPVRLLESNSHVGNFIAAVKSRGPTVCPIEDAVQAEILCHLSDIATRLKRKLRWDPAKERFLKDDEANKRLALRPVTAGLRKDCREIYPSRQILELARAKGVAITFGSDAHTPDEVGLGFAEAVQLARRVGYRQHRRLAGRRGNVVSI